MVKGKMPTADQLMGMWQASGLKQKLLYTFIIVAIFRFGAQIPVFGINSEAFQAQAAQNNLIGFLDLFTGGALGKVSIFALGIGPFITASIIMQLLGVVIPHLEKLQKEEGEDGRRKIQQYTRYFTVILAVFQSSVLMAYLSKAAGVIIPDQNVFMVFTAAVVSLTAGAAFVMWLAELITENGMGNGASLLIFVSILSQLTVYSKKTAELISGNPTLQVSLLVLLAIFLATIFMIVILQDAVRKVVVVNARRQVGNKVYGGASTHIPFKLNPGGVMPIIFAVAILLFPTTILSVVGRTNIENDILNNIITFLSAELLNPGNFPYYVIYFVLIVGLTFFYASIMPNMQPKDIANNLKKHGSSIPGVKPGKPTADMIDKILSRTTFIGALALGVIAIIPGIASKISGITTMQGIGATALIIMVGVALDFINQIKTHLLVRQYEGFLKQ